MSRIFVKICGLRTPEAIEAAVGAGADALGFVMTQSPRRVTPAEARDLCAGLAAGVIRVAVMRHPRPHEWSEVRDLFRPDWLQTEAGDFDALAPGAGVRPLPVYRDTPGLDESGAAAAGTLLFESGTSGMGQAADWDRAARLARRARLILAGGLDPDNVAAAIERVRPWGVDVSSGVERSRGEKDPARIAAFVRAVRQLESRYAD